MIKTDIYDELKEMPQYKVYQEEVKKKGVEDYTPATIEITKQYEQVKEIIDEKWGKKDIEVLKEYAVGPAELLPALNDPSDIQDLRNIDEANQYDIREWIDTAVEVLPEICIETQNIKQQIGDNKTFYEPLDHGQTQIASNSQTSALFQSSLGIKLEKEKAGSP